MIKIRIWNKKFKKFQYTPNDYEDSRDESGNYVGWYESEGTDADILLQTLEDVQEDNDYVIQQYTGLSDCNNKEIYDGDVIRFTPDIRQYMKLDCVWKNLGHVWIRDLVYGANISFNHFHSENSMTWNNLLNKYYFTYRHKTILQYEVVGNIFETPEIFNESD